MASISAERNGRRVIQFFGGDGKRRSIRLGKASQRFAEAVKHKVENLVAASITGHALDDETARWVAALDTVMGDKLADVGLIPKREAATLAAFLDAVIASRSDVKPATAITFGNVRRNLVDHFGEDKPLRDITAGDADNWRLHLIREGLADNTVRRRCGIAKQMFTVAARRRLIGFNPFADLTSAVRGNPSRYRYVTRADAAKIIEACPNAEWRLIFSLSRFGGLRCPSEHLALKWADVDWARGRVTVRSSKTEHHVGGDCRVIPLFPELLPHLREVFENAEPGTEHVVTRYRDPGQNLRTQFERIIRKAGLKPWPKLFQNLRSSRETELAESWPLHVVCAWLGNSRLVA
ncbi:MAG: tyrosine-type recombinase/integrase, partial [Chloroflexi bacterium]|nr:tyrosine-type recombinase/integrase [Chloroflexota bacterium]